MSLWGLSSLSGCGQQPDDPKIKPEDLAPKVEKKEPEPDIVYDRARLDDDTYAPKERIAAFLDYLGAVYRFGSDAKFDGVLTSAEKKYVTSNIIPENYHEVIESSSRFFLAEEIDVILYSARMRFYSLRISSSPYEGHKCGVVVRTELESEEKSAVLYTGDHACFHRYGAKYMLSGDELSIAAHPENWVFSYQSDYYPTPEVALFERIGNVLDIPKIDAIDPLASPEVVNETAKAYRRYQKDYWVAMAYDIFRNMVEPYIERFARKDEINASEVTEVFNQALDIFKQTVELEYKERAEIEVALIQFCGARDQMETMDEIWQAYFSKYERLDATRDRRIKELVGLANQRSKETLKVELEEQAQKGRSKTVFISNYLRDDLISEIYKTE